MKALDVFVWAVLIIGGLNWGLVGIFDVNLVEAIFGGASRLVYSLVGLAALYDLLGVKAITKRWDIHMHSTSHA
ncbi:MAG: DUF378 domain-containing protein [Sedimentisphaeraceae bacterium JB056]